MSCSGGELNDDVLGKTFQIVDVETRYRHDGEAVPAKAVEAEAGDRSRC